MKEESEADDSSQVKKAGRRSGMTAEAMLKKDTAIRIAQDSVAIEYDSKRREAKKL